MAIENGYSSPDLVSATCLLRVKEMLDIESADTNDDAILERIIGAASRKIDERTGRFFYVLSAQTFYYRAVYSDLFELPHDLLVLTSLATDPNADGVWEEVWATTDYVLAPYNAVAFKEPYTQIEIAHLGHRSFPAGIKRGTKLVGNFGYWTSVPDLIVEACKLQSVRWFKRKDAIFGVQGTTDFGTVQLKIPALDPDIASMLEGFQKSVAIAGAVG